MSGGGRKPPWRKQEQRLAELVGGSRVAGSGAFWTKKGDVRTDDLLIEAKHTSAGSFSIKGIVWDKIRKEALLDGRTPVLALEIGQRRLVVLAEEDFIELRSIRTVDPGELP